MPGVRCFPRGMVGQQMKVAFAALKTFDSSDGEAWENYIAWSKLAHLSEVVTHDSSLCPSVVKQVIAEDWEHMAYSDVSPFLLSDVDYLLTRVGLVESKFQIIATAREPERGEVKSFSDARFRFKGYDLVDGALGTSALTNCGGFDEAFTASDLSECGLVEDYDRALAVRELLSRHYPEESHAACEVWAVWRMESNI